MWLYIQKYLEGQPDSKEVLWVFEVGYYRPAHNYLNDEILHNWQVWTSFETYDNLQDAARRVNYLNGGNGFPFDLGIPKKEETWDERLKRLKRFLEDAKQARGQ